MPLHRFKQLALAGAACMLAAGALAQEPLLAGEQAVVITAIPGVIAADAKWELVWAGFETADGIVGTADGGVLFAQEQTDTIRKLDSNNKEYVYMKNVAGPGAVSIDAQGRVYSVLRTCTDPGKWHYQSCNELTKVVQLAPESRVLASSFPDGRPLGRLNDLIADGKGGAYFTVGGAYYVNPEGKVITVEDKNLVSNGIMLSRDGKTLYVTNNTVVIAFEVAKDGTTGKRRDFVSLNGDNGGDGMAIDNDGRLYITGSKGIHVASEKGEYLGLIPTRRRPITLAFAGTDKSVLYAPSMGAVGPDGKAWATPDGTRNTAMTVYRIRMQSHGFAGRPK
jgi:gluconolactonase